MRPQAHSTSNETPSGALLWRSNAVPESTSQSIGIAKPFARAERGTAGRARRATNGVPAGPDALKLKRPGATR